MFFPGSLGQFLDETRCAAPASDFSFGFRKSVPMGELFGARVIYAIPVGDQRGRTCREKPKGICLCFFRALLTRFGVGFKGNQKDNHHFLGVPLLIPNHFNHFNHCPLVQLLMLQPALARSTLDSTDSEPYKWDGRVAHGHPIIVTCCGSHIWL